MFTISSTTWLDVSRPQPRTIIMPTAFFAHHYIYIISLIPIIKNSYVISLQYLVPPGWMCRGPNCAPL